MSRRCIACDKEATKRLTVDLDITGIHVCDDCVDDVKVDFMYGLLVDDFEHFEDKYYGDKPVNSNE